MASTTNDFFNEQQWSGEAATGTTAPKKPIGAPPAALRSRRAAPPPPIGGPPKAGTAATAATTKPLSSKQLSSSSLGSTSSNNSAGLQKKKFASRAPPPLGKKPGSVTAPSATGTAPAAARPPTKLPSKASSGITSSSGIGGIGTANSSTTPSYYLSANSTANSNSSASYYSNPGTQTAGTAPSSTSTGDSSAHDWYTGFDMSHQQTTDSPSQPAYMNPYETSNNSVKSQPVANMQQWQTPHTEQQPQQQPQSQQSQPPSFMNFFSNSQSTDTNFGNNSMDSGSQINPQQMMNPIDAEDYENEPPLLEELGINIEHIILKTKAVILPSKRLLSMIDKTNTFEHLDPHVIIEDADLAGPFAFALMLGGELLITGKMHFGYIYGFSLFGCLAMTLILNLLTLKPEPISIWTVTSILGYSLLPVNILALLKILIVNIINLQTFGRILAIVAVLWSTTAATRLLELGCGMSDQRYLIGYPLGLLYTAFVLLTIF